MTKNNAARRDPSRRDDEQKLDSRYGRIGISAVAAALPYRTEAKTSGEPVATRRQLDRSAAEQAA